MKTILFSTAVLLCLNFSSHAETISEPEKLSGAKIAESNKSSGSSKDNPIRVEKITDFDELNRWVEDYLKSNYPAYRVMLVSYYGRYKDYYIRVVILENREKEQLPLYFDISDYKNAFFKKHPNFLKEIEKKLDKVLKKRPIGSAKNDGPAGMDYHYPLVLNCKTKKEVVQAQNKILETNFPDHEEVWRETWLHKNRYIERVSLKKGDEYVIFNFDISTFMKEYLKTHKVKSTKLTDYVTKIEML